MKDQEIRRILIAYLKVRHKEVRIYQEKSIGSAICDVMAVTEKLTGYEIKSDGDNYQRLERQIEFYDKFFDENYIVVSHKHITSAENKVPKYWGIIYIDDHEVNFVRKAANNAKVSRRSQLTVLWKLELKNLLIKNNLPLYAQKEKGYISDKICQNADPKILGEQIAYELMHRDYSVYDAKDYTVYSKQEDYGTMPALDIMDSLSEQDFDQLTLDKWIELYKNAKQLQKEKESLYEKKEVIRPPHEITYQDIEVSLGAPWISKDIIDDFISYMISGNHKERYHLAEYEAVTGAWHINGKNQYRNSNITSKFGTNRYNALFIIEATLNLREIKLYDEKGNFDEGETIAVLEKQKLINREFRIWVWEDDDRKWQIEEAYNKIFAKYHNETFDGSKLLFPEMNPEFELFEYQKNAVQRIISTPNTLLAFDVGAGKTYIMIAAAMKMREMGISHKNMFVVPNNIVGQWEKIFTTLYPRAKVLTIEPRTFKPQMRQKVLTQIKNGNYDGIIIAYSCFEQIPLSVEYLTYDMQNELNEIETAINTMRNSTKYIWGRSALDREMQYIKKLAADLLGSAKTESSCITFESLEINTIFLDEAHNFKNIPIRTKLKELRGINVKGSKKCLEMMQKIRCVQQFNNGRGAVLATGTPLCNSISDAYTMQMYLQYDELRTHNLEKFDNWVKTFAEPEQVCEVDVTASNYRFVRRFARFFNLPELSNMFSGIAVFYSMDTTDGVPQNAKYTDIQVKKCVELSSYMDEICKRTEEIRSGKINPKYDNMLKVSTDGRKAALDLTLVGACQPYDEYSKIVQCAETVWSVYNDYSGCSQLVFCDNSTPKANEFNVYSKMKELLIERGVCEKEIAFIHSFNSESAKLKLYEAVNSGKIRILIGSTFKLGIGANVQTKLKAIHHLDVPWRPADMIQREGRILRRGNENKEVSIFRYITEGSFDSYSWQILETKQRFISQFLSGTSYQRSIEDLDNNVLSYAEVKAIALSNPIMKQVAEKENEIKTLQILCNKYAENKRKLKERASELTTEIAVANVRYQNTIKNERYLNTVTNDRYLEEMKEAKEILTKELICDSKPGKKLISFLGFEVRSADQLTGEKTFVILKRADTEYRLEVGQSPVGNIKRIVNFLKRFRNTVKAELENLQKKQKEYDEIQISLSLPNEHHDKLLKCKQELRELMEVAKRNQLVER